MLKTYKIRLKRLKQEDRDLLWSASQESAIVYNHALKVYTEKLQEKHKNKPQAVYLACKAIPRQYLHSQSFQSAYEACLQAWKAYFEALKSYKKNPELFTDKPQPPSKTKFLRSVDFKISAIKKTEKSLVLSFNNRKYLSIPWNTALPKPNLVKIKLDKNQWYAFIVIEFDKKTENLDKNKVLSIDLGVKRLATCYQEQNKQTTFYSGKPILSINHLSEKKGAEIKRLLHDRKYKKDSRKHKKIVRAFNKQFTKHANRKKDYLHKVSRSIVNEAVKNQIGTIVIGDCSSIHQSPNLGKSNNGKISRNPDAQLKDLIKDKFSRITGSTVIVPEYYSSQTCPICLTRTKPKNRKYQCKCGFTCDRDRLGAINILKHYRSEFSNPDRTYRPTDEATPKRKLFCKVNSRIESQKFSKLEFADQKEPTAFKR